MAARGRKRGTPAPVAPVVRRDVWTWAAPLGVAVAALLAYANSLGNGFVWDDPIILSRQLVVFRSLGDVLVPPRDIPQFSPDYYRPLTIATYLLDRAVGGEQPFVFHLSVVILHAATAVLVYLLAMDLLGSTSAACSGALGAGLLFALHPIHTESVAWAAGRSDVLATGFIVAAVLVHGRPPWSWRRSIATGLCAAGALGAKETGVALYPLLFLRDVLCPATTTVRAKGHVGTSERQHVSTSDRLTAYAGVAIAGLVYVLLRRTALGEYVGTAIQETPVRRSPLEVGGALGMYIEKLVWPSALSAYIDHLDTGPLQIGAALLLVVGLAAAAWRWWASRGDGVPLFALLWIALTLVPSLAILWKIPDAPLAERYLYLPSVGFSLLIGDAIARVLTRVRGGARVAVGVVAALILLAAGIATAWRNPVWHDDIALWEDTESKSQVSGMAARSVGTAYQQAGRAAEARAAFERALGRRNTARGVQAIHNNLGTLAMYDGDYAAARRHYEAALQANPGAADTIFNVGVVILRAGGATPAAAREALPHFQRAGEINPHDPDVEAGLGQAYVILGERERARGHLQRALSLRPDARTAQGVHELLRQLEAPPP
jgi:tetratricopeptide (TPR) repeat protein